MVCSTSGDTTATHRACTYVGEIAEHMLTSITWSIMGPTSAYTGPLKSFSIHWFPVTKAENPKFHMHDFVLWVETSRYGENPHRQRRRIHTYTAIWLVSTCTRQILKADLWQSHILSNSTCHLQYFLLWHHYMDTRLTEWSGIIAPLSGRSSSEMPCESMNAKLIEDKESIKRRQKST